MTCFERVLVALGRIRDYVATQVNSSEVARLTEKLAESATEKEQIAGAVEGLADELTPTPPPPPPQDAPEEVVGAAATPEDVEAPAEVPEEG